jgi:hypothetical protein
MRLEMLQLLRLRLSFLLTFDTNVFPAFMDYKMRTVPKNIPADYYGWNGNAEKSVGDDKSSDEEVDLGA